MNTRKRASRLVVWAVGVALALGCAREGTEASPQAVPPSAGDSPVVARLNGEPLTIADLRSGSPGALRMDRGHALDAAVARRLAAQEARRRGLDATSDVRAQIEALQREAAAREDALLQGALETSLAAQVAVTDDELRARYEQTQGRYTERRLRLRRIAFPTAEAAHAEDERLGPDGRLDPAASEEIGPAPVQKLMQMQVLGVMRLREPGQRVVVEREGGFALLELVEVLPPAPPPFEEVRAQIESELRAQRAGEAFAKLSQELRAAAKLEIDEAVLKDDAAWQPTGGEAAPLRQPWR
jgi:hypothetical protein